MTNVNQTVLSKNVYKTQDINFFTDLLNKSHPAEVADFIANQGFQEFQENFDNFEHPALVKIFKYLPLANQQEFFANRECDKVTIRWFLSLNEYQQSLLLRALDSATKSKVLDLLPNTLVKRMEHLLSYADETAGSVMTTRFIALQIDMTVEQAIAKLSLEYPQSMTTYYGYITSKSGHLLGVVNLKTLLQSKSSQLVEEIMTKAVVHVDCYDDQELVAQKLHKYRFLALPVLDKQARLVGIINHEQVMDIMQQEQTEDIEKLMAISGAAPTSYLNTSVFSHFKRRIGWLTGLAVVGLISGLILHSFEDTLEALFILALYIPMVADTGGNAGSQASTVVIRSLALKEIQLKHIFKILYKEFSIASIAACILGALAFGKVMFLSAGVDIPLSFSLDGIAFVIAMALGLQVITSTMIGALLPLIAVRLKLDPAVVASPILTTVVDITGLLIYFFLATKILGLS